MTDQRTALARRVAEFDDMRAERRQREISLEAATLLTEGKVAEAVRVIRDSEGISLREARQRIDAHVANDPMLGVQLQTQRREFRRKLFHVFLVIDAIIVAGAIYYFFFMPR